MYRTKIYFLIAFGVAPIVSGAIIGTNISALPVTAKRVAGLPVEQQPAWKKYLERSERQLREDQSFLANELRKHGLKESLPAPKGQRESRLSLRQSAEWYGQPEALRIADIVVSFQTPAGGWSKGVDNTKHRRAPGGQFYGDLSVMRLGKSDDAPPTISEWNYNGTFDNSAMTTQLRYLAKVSGTVEAKRGQPYRAAFMRGMDYIFAAHYPNGGWPQVWPLQGGYNDAITYNDDAMLNTIQLLSEVAKGESEFSFVPKPTRERAAKSVQRGIECILKSQIVVKGRRTVWCQQHDALTLEPTSARNYEMPSQCDSESARLMMFLMRLPDPDTKIITSIHAAAAWFEKTKLLGVECKVLGEEGKKLIPSPGAGPIWARYYEIGSDRPIFGDRDKTIHDDMNDLSKERRNGYGWFNDTPQQALEEYALWKKTHPPATRQKEARL